MQERHKCGCEVNNKEQEIQLTLFPCNSHSACSHLRLTDRSMGYGVHKALFIAKRWKERQEKKKKKPRRSDLHMIQDPLEEGGVVNSAVCLHILLSGMG